MEVKKKDLLINIFRITVAIAIVGLFAAGLAGLMISNWILAGIAYSISIIIALCMALYNAYKKRQSYYGKNPIKITGIIAAVTFAEHGKYRVFININENTQAVAYTRKKTLKNGDPITVKWSEENPKICRIVK